MKSKFSTKLTDWNENAQEHSKDMHCWFFYKVGFKCFLHCARKHDFAKSIYKFGLSVCLSVCLFVCIQYTSKRLNRSGPNFLWDIMWPQGKFMNDKNFKKCVLKVINFVKKNSWKSVNFFLKIRRKFLFLNVNKRRCSQFK